MSPIEMYEKLKEEPQNVSHRQDFDFHSAEEGLSTSAGNSYRWSMNHEDYHDSSRWDVYISPRGWTGRQTKYRHPGWCVMWETLLRQILNHAPKIIGMLVIIPIVIREKKNADKKDDET